MAVLAHSRAPAQLSGNGGIALLKDLTNSSENMTAVNNTTVNLSHSSVSVPLSGNNGTTVLKNLINTSLNLSWGSIPRVPPPPPQVDYKQAQMNVVIRQNHLGY